ncbi:Ribosomal RNA large subunit methyltransferase K/L [Pirellulimonas nuda]|uniref:Ribosomal RNA large subunit methyltransferase K/L n=1 Tax=Pirellulimonas nuda TaxID=2528009 RepID=A0A518D9V5_9BACT|nr:bifunctional 23S rRNA (guanine(2069)-N(7))-methyltransferase RlmK/23S rRNA (guanine(2445)-N(2))-methyltransferase RlmL [Pirellulimonas nuda]QDU88269.1 Ribosomal RNA large subunit methyltransferase K/L [Pirellulimonas nuda]
MTLQLVATAAFGLEAVVVRELAALGYEAKVRTPGRIYFTGDARAICRANLWLRSAERVLIEVATFAATDFGELFEGVRAAPWEQWIPSSGSFPVNGRSRKSQLSSVPACQKIVKKAIVERLRDAHGVVELPESGAEYAVEVALLDDRATVTLDTTGVGLHKRGYRPLNVAAPLRETLAAAIVQLSVWRPGRPLIDPFCGAGTIAIEAAMIGRNLAPGAQRTFAFEEWPGFDAAADRLAREEARDLAQGPLEERIVANDSDPDALKVARRHAAAAGVEEDIHFQQRDFGDLLSRRAYGCVIANPPYGERIGESRELAALYQSMPTVLRRLPTWSHYIITAYPEFERLLGQQADRRRKLYNGQIECTLFQFLGPKPPRGASADAEAATEGDEAPLTAPTSTPLPKRAKLAADQRPVFGGLRPEAARQTEELANRLAKTARHLRRWPEKRGVTCFRLYDRDIPDVPLAIDRYEDALHIAEYERPHERTPAQHADWLDLMTRTAADTLGVDRSLVFLKRRARQHGDEQYTRVGDEGAVRLVGEAGLQFRVNLSDYLDTGLFLDHRVTRAMVRDAAKGKRFLNLFAYTGAFSVYAAAGGAAETITVDLSPTYLDWAQENFAANALDGHAHYFVRDDSRRYVASLPEEPRFDLAVVDPPTFSNTKRTGPGASPTDDWDVQRDAAGLLEALALRMSPGGLVFFSTNFRRFRLDEAELPSYQVREISRQTVPEDFRNKRIHRCWRLTRRDEARPQAT